MDELAPTAIVVDSVNAAFASESDESSSLESFRAAMSRSPNHSALYKTKGHTLAAKQTPQLSQEERRRVILIEQKKKRQLLVESNRSLSEEQKRPNQVTNAAKATTKFNQRYSNQLMYSEWLEEVPSDFTTNWIMVLSPVGKRCLVVASEGTTSVYNKAGKLIARHSSLLPGGNRGSKSEETILDCVYNDHLRTYFILDCICWKSHPIVDSETEFRFFWLKCKLDEVPNVKKWTRDNPYAFKDVNRLYPLSVKTIQELVESQIEPKMDGLLFYHKETHYTPGDTTPLVTWLKPYMLPDILNIAVSQRIVDTAPSDYTTARQAIEADKSRTRLVMINRATDLSMTTTTDDDEEEEEDDTMYGDEHPEQTQ